MIRFESLKDEILLFLSCIGVKLEDHDKQLGQIVFFMPVTQMSLDRMYEMKIK